MSKFFGFLSGKKSNLAALGLALSGVASIVSGDVGAGVTQILEGASVAALRAGIAKSGRGTQ